MNIWPFNSWQLTEKDWKKLMAQLKSSADVLDELNAKIDENASKVEALQIQQAEIKELVVALVNDAANVDEAKLQALLDKINSQSAELDELKVATDETKQAGQQPVE